jgi:hypothetical protein
MKWKRAVHAAQTACNNFLENTSTKYTPHEITRGNPYKSYMNNILSNQNKAATNNNKAKQLQQQNYNKNTTNIQFKVNDWVLINNFNKTRQFDPLRIGPFKIIKVLENNNYLVHNHLRGKYLGYNVSQLSKYSAPTEKLIHGPIGTINGTNIENKSNLNNSNTIQIGGKPNVNIKQEKKVIKIDDDDESHSVRYSNESDSEIDKDEEEAKLIDSDNNNNNSDTYESDDADSDDSYKDTNDTDDDYHDKDEIQDCKNRNCYRE